MQELTDEQRSQIMSSQDFRAFFDSASRVIEKALSEKIDPYFPYCGDNLKDRWVEIGKCGGRWVRVLRLAVQCECIR